MAQKKKHIVLGVTGSIAAYKAADIIRRLQDRNLDVSVVMTSNAAKFITPLTLASLSGKKVFLEMFRESDTVGDMTHITLAQSADVFLIAPATANVIGKLAHGIADDLLTCLALVTKAPILVAPAMNDAMYEKKQVQDNCKKLKEYGYKFICPIEGKLACGSSGVGHLAEVEDIVSTVEKFLAT